jgi:hypothetical protein
VPQKGYEEKLHMIGEFDNPIYVCKKKEVRELFDADFHRIYVIWRNFHYGFGLPFPGGWIDQDPELIEVLVMLEAYFQKNFSSSSVIIKYMEMVLQRENVRCNRR